MHRRWQEPQFFVLSRMACCTAPWASHSRTPSLASSVHRDLKQPTSPRDRPLLWAGRSCRASLACWAPACLGSVATPAQDRCSEWLGMELRGCELFVHATGRLCTSEPYTRQQPCFARRPGNQVPHALLPAGWPPRNVRCPSLPPSWGSTAWMTRSAPPSCTSQVGCPLRPVVGKGKLATLLGS